MRTYVQLTGLIFGIIALLHATRLVFDWPAVIAGWSVPGWVSWLGILVPGALCIWAIRLAAGARQ